MAFDKRKAFQNALNFTQQGKWDKAIAEYQAILRSDPRDLTACNSLGDLYARLGKAGEAIEQYLKLGELFRADGLAVKAIAVYKKIVKLAPTRIDALLACADLYEEQGLSGEAKIQLAVVAEHYRRKGDTGKLVGVYQRLAQLDPTNHVLITNLGDLLLREGKRELAAAQYELAAQAAQAAGHAGETKRLLKKVHELRPGSPEISRLTLAEASLSSGRYADAVEMLAKITSTDARNGEAWRLLGEAYSHLGQAPEAIGALERAMDLGIPEARVQRTLATALVQADRSAEGIILCQRIAEEAINRGEADEAISTCQGILTVAPHLTSMHSYVAGLLERLGRHEEARAAAWAWAAAHEAAGETEAAIAVYRQLLERDPSDAEARARLEVLEGVPDEGMTPAPDTLAEKAVSSTAMESAPLEQGPEFLLEELVPEEPAAPELSLSMEDARTLLDEPSLVVREGMEPEFPPSRVIELDDTGEIAGTRRASEDPAGGSLDRLAGLHAPGVQIPEEGLADALSELEAVAAEEEASGEVAEQLAEAEVYLKYGLAEKARERLLEVVRLAPENLVARIRLKDLHLERSQNQDACRQIAAIARILEARAHWDMALALVRQGLALVPNHPELEGLAAKLSGGTVAPGKTPPAAPPVKPADELVQPFDIPETVGPPGDPNLTAVTSAPLEQESGQDGAPALDDVAGPDAEGLEVAPLDLPPPQRAPQMEGPPFTPAPAEGGHVEPLEDLDKFLTEQSLAGDEASVLEGELPAELRALLEEPGLAGEADLVIEEGDASLDQAMADELTEAKFYLSQGMTEEARAVYRRMQARAPEHPEVARLAGELQALPIVGPSAVAEEPAGKIKPAGALPEDPGAESPEGSAMADLSGLGGSEVPDARPQRGAPRGGVKPVKAETSAGQSSQRPTPASPPPRQGPPSDRAAGGSTLPPGKGREAVPPEPAALPAQELPLDQVVPKFSVQHSEDERGAGGFVNLGAELEEELAAEDRAAAGVSSGPLVDDLVKEFQKGVREHLDEKDFETHYNLGIAYKEMQLYDEAIEAFRLAGKDPGRTLACASLMGLCYLAKGEAEAAIQEFRRGLDVRGHAREAYHALRYDLGAAYETHGDLEAALEAFESLLAEDERFRDVRNRVKGLRERVQQQRATAVPAAPVEAQDPPQPAKGKKKKISFI